MHIEISMDLRNCFKFQHLCHTQKWQIKVPELLNVLKVIDNMIHIKQIYLHFLSLVWILFIQKVYKAQPLKIRLILPVSYKYFLIYELDLNYVIKVYNGFYIWSVIYQCVKTTFICFKNQSYDVNIIRMLATLAIKVSHTSYSALNKIISLNSIKRFLFAFGFFDAF